MCVWFFFSEIERKIKDMNVDYQQLFVDFSDFQKRQEKLNSEKFELDREVDKQQAKLGNRESDFEALLKDYEYAKEREAMLMGDRCVIFL